MLFRSTPSQAPPVIAIKPVTQSRHAPTRAENKPMKIDATTPSELNIDTIHADSESDKPNSVRNPGSAGGSLPMKIAATTPRRSAARAGFQ